MFRNFNKMKFVCVVFFMTLAITLAKQCSNRRTNSKLICYYSEVKYINTCMCTHIILPANSNAQIIESVQEKFKGGQVLLTANEFNENLVSVLKNNKIDGLEINLKKLDDKNDVPDFISTVKSKFGSDLLFAVSIPATAEHLAKYYDLKALTKHADLFILQTAFLGTSQNVTFHPSRLSGLWDMQNIDSVVDLVTGMGAPLSKLVITAPVQAFQFTLQDETYTAPGSPALEIKSITREQLCNTMSRGSNWTLERDQDQAGPYIFRKNKWIAFDDATSMDIKAKYTRVRGLAGLALKDLAQDGGEKCGTTLLEAAHAGLAKQSRAPRGAVLQSLEREILETPSRTLDTIQISPYRITRVIDVDGNMHSIRQDTRTEFECARQGYFVHPRSCGRFYRCVKFDQLADDFSVFEFDCPAGLSFDSRYEVCVWPGSLPYSSPCSGSSEIAPVPRTRFVCPQTEGYYADPENCRWFFACLDHGKSPLSAYEFRCPFGLVFDESRLVCEWPWAVPRCGSGSAVGFGYGSQISLGGARLDTYDGLGALGVVGLGGLSGPLIQPQAKVYSNVASVDSIHQAKLQDNLGYTQTEFNQGISGSSGVSGGSFQTFHSKGSGIELSNLDKSIGNGNRGSSLFSGGSIFNQNNYGASGGSTYSNAGVVLQQQTSGLLENGDGFSHSKNDQSQEAVGLVTGINGASYKTNVDYGSKLGNIGVKTGSFINHGVTQQQLSSSGVNSHHHQTNFGGVHTNDHSQGAVYPVVPVENVHIIGGFSAVGTGGKASAEDDQNNIKINNIAQVSHAAPISTFSIVLPSAVPSVAAAPVPVVKSDLDAYEKGVVANVPELQYKIVAPSASNVYFQSNFKDNTDYSLSRSIFGIANISQNYVNYVSSTPTPLALSTVNYEYNAPTSSFRHNHVVHQGYSYPKPSTIFEEQSVQAVTPATVSHISFAAHSSSGKSPTINSYVTPRTQEVLQPAVVSSFSFNNAQKSVAAVQPILTVTPTVPIIQQKIQPAIVSSYNFQNIVKNKPIVSVKPSVYLKEPASTVSSFSFQNSFAAKQNYEYRKPNAVFGEKIVYPVQPNAGFHVEHDVGKTLSSGTQYSGTKFNQYNQASRYNNEGSVLQQQNIAFLGNQGAFLNTKHDQTQGVVGEIQGASYQTNIDYGRNIPAVVSTHNFNSVQKQQPVVSVTPVVPVVEHRVEPQVLSVTPTTLTAAQKVHAAFFSNVHNYQNSLQHEGYQYSKPSVTFNDQPPVVSSFSIRAQNPLPTVQPVINVNPTVHTIQQKIQPGIVSSYSFQNIGHNHGYENAKATISENIPTRPILQQSSHTVQPTFVSSFSFQNLTRNAGYNYFKQAVPGSPVINVTPATTIIKETLQQHPAVVSSYNLQNNFNNRAYQTMPVVSVTETVPIIQHRIKPLQPAVFSSYSYQNDEGFKYTKQAVPLQPVPSVTPIVPIIQKNVQPAIVSSYSFQNQANNEDYKYTKQTVPLLPVPSITPIAPLIQKNVQPAIVSSYSFQNDAHNEGYKYTKQTVPLQPIPSVTPIVPIIQKNVQPAIVSSYSFQNKANNEDYKYTKQTVHLQPVTSVTPIVPIIQKNVQPAIVSSYSFQNEAHNEGYKYTKQTVPLQPVPSVTPIVPIIQKNVQPEIVSSYSFQNQANNEDYKYNKQTVPLLPVPSVTPIVPLIQKNVQPAIVSSYSFQNQANNEDYKYSKQIVPFQPVASVTPTVPIIQKNVQPAIVSNFNYHVSYNGGYSKQTPAKPILPVEDVSPVVPFTSHKNVYSAQPSISSSYAFQNRAKNENLDYSKQISVQPVAPTIPTVINPVKPSVITSYSFNNVAKSTLPTIVSSFNIQKSVENGNFNGYEYRKPSISFEERPLQPTSSVISNTPLVRFANVQQPIPTQSPSVFSHSFKNAEEIKNNYNFISKSITPVAALEPILRVTTPTVPVIRQRVQTVAPVIIPYNLQPSQNDNGNFGKKLSVSAQKPIIIEDTIISKQQITIKHPQTSVNEQNYESKKPVEEVLFVAKKAYVTTGHEQNQGGYNYPKPAISFEEGPSVEIPVATFTIKNEPVTSKSYRGKVSFTTPTYVEDYYYTTPRSNIYISTPVPFSTTLKSKPRINSASQNSGFYTSSPKPSYTSTVAAILAAKTQSLGQFEFSNSRLQSSGVPTYSPSGNSQYGEKYSTYASTSKQNSFDDSVAVSIPKQIYLPHGIVKGEYSTATLKQSAPAVVHANIGGKPKTYIRVNDFHPFLPAKLGAQCTCTSKTLTLRRKPTVTIPLPYEATSDDGYFVKANTNQNLDNANIPVQNGRAVLENYVYEPKRFIEVSPSPSVIIKSTTNTILPAPAPAFIVRKRVRVSQATTPATLFSTAVPLVQVTQDPEVFLKKTFNKPVYNEAESRPYNAEIVDVNKALNRKEAISDRTFDRYGPGGWRSRQETLQGTIDCQRAGLFRHPEQCNKFYACRWDCTKKRFTLHVFNCPVHLTFDSNMGACNWPSQGPACAGNTLLPNE